MAQVASRSGSARRSEVVRAAATLFSARGYHGTSMQHLADALGLQRGSLYAHIGSKEELLLEVVNDGAARFLDRGRRALEADASAAERLRIFLVGHMETVAEHLDAATVFLNEWRYLSEPLKAAVSAQRDRYEAIARTIIERGVASGEFRKDADVRFASMLVLSAGNWMYEWYRPAGDLAPDQIAHRFCEIVLQGLERGERPRDITTKPSEAATEGAGPR